MTSVCVDIVYITKLKKFKFLNIIYTTLTKIDMIIILPISIKIFLKKSIIINALLKYKICIMQLDNLSYLNKKIIRYTPIFQIGYNFCYI